MNTAKRQYGEGAISSYSTKAGVRFQVKWYEPADADDPDGEKVRRSKAGFTTKKAAATFLRETLSAVDRGLPTRAGDGPTLGAFIPEWLDGHRGAASTVAGYRRLWRLHIEPNLGDMPLGRIRPSTLARLYRQLETTGRRERGREGEGLGPNTVRKVHDLISVALQAALADGLIASNPARQPGAKPPTGRQVKAAKPELTVWTPAELATFLRWAERHDPDFYACWVLAGRTGMRRGELLGLQWGDVDLGGGQLTVRRTKVAVKEKGKAGRVDTKPPKGGRPRTVSLDDVTVCVLRTHRTSTAGRMLTAAARNAPVFTLASGDPCHPDRLTRRWERACEVYADMNPGAPLPHLTLHGLRHTHASHLLAAGVPAKVVQERLGHETISITLDLYTHLMPTSQAEAAQKLAALLGEA